MLYLLDRANLYPGYEIVIPYPSPLAERPRAGARTTPPRARFSGPLFFWPADGGQFDREPSLQSAERDNHQILARHARPQRFTLWGLHARLMSAIYKKPRISCRGRKQNTLPQASVRMKNWFFFSKKVYYSFRKHVEQEQQSRSSVTKFTSTNK